MKIGKHFGIISALVLVAGCSRHEQAHYTDYGTAYSSTPTYQQPTTTTSSASTSPQSTNDTDRTLVSQVQQSLRQDNTLAPLMPGIQVSAQNGSVTLSGNVSSEQEKQRIESMVKSTSGVVSVNNQLQVAGVSPTSDRPGQGTRLYQEATPSSTPSATKPDSSTSTTPTPDTSAATNALNTTTTPAQPSDSALSPTSQPGASSRIYSQTNTGAENFSLNVQGLTEADRNLGQKIQEEVRKDSSLAGQLSLIKLNVDNGKIILTGKVKSEDQKQSIEKATQRVTGVNSIDNQLQVSGSATDTSADAAQPAPQK
jgi:osmotically-inducible protein OsmY